MKHAIASFPAIFVILLIAASLMGTAIAKMATPRPPASISPMPLPFSGDINSISGRVYDSSGNGIPMAKVTLYYTVWVGTEYKAKDPVKTDDDNNNPQFTSDGSMSPAGLYVYTNIPPGVYVLTAEKGGISVSDVIMVTGGTTTRNLLIPGYVGNNATTTPWPTAKPGPAYRPTPVPGNAQKPDVGAILLEVLKILLMGVIGVQLVVSIVVIALHVGRQH